VRAASIEIRAVLSKHTGQMSYAKDDDVIKHSRLALHNALRIDIDHEEGEDWSEPDIVGLQEITGPDSMIPQESVPILTAREFRWSSLAHVSLDRTLRNSDAELQEFAAYSLGTSEAFSEAMR